MKTFRVKMYLAEEGGRILLQESESSDVQSEHYFEQALATEDNIDRLIDGIVSKLRADGVEQADMVIVLNAVAITFTRPPYMSQRGLRMYIRQWLNTFDEVEIWKEKEGLINE